MVNQLTYFEALLVVLASAYTGFIYGMLLNSSSIKKKAQKKRPEIMADKKGACK